MAQLRPRDLPRLRDDLVTFGSAPLFASVEWHHQWIVRGHWRNQAFGEGRKQRRPTWISPYVKGPEDAPMLGGEKVYMVNDGGKHG